MKVQGSAVAAYTRHQPVARQGDTKVQGQARNEPESAEIARFSVADFFSLSPKAQSGVVERMLLTSIGEKIGVDFAEQGINLEDHIDEDQSPDAVSTRIVDFATGMFSVFQAQNPELGESELLNRFEETLRGAVDLGYEQANGVLDTIERVDDEIRSTGASTMDLVHEKLDAFFADRRAGGAGPAPG